MIVDITDPLTPKVLSRLPFFMAFALDVSGSSLFAVGFNLLRVVDISDPVQPRLVSELVLPGAFTAGISIGEGFAFTMSDEGIVSAINIANLAAPFLTSTLQLPASPGAELNIRTSGRLAFAGGGSQGVHILDISNPSAMKLLATADGTFFASDMDRTGDLLVSADRGLSIVRIFNVRTPSTPQFVGSLDHGRGKGFGTRARDNLVFATIPEQGVVIGKLYEFVDNSVVPPAVNLLAPVDGETVFEGQSLFVSASATDDVAVQSVEFIVDGTSKFVDLAAPYAFEFVVPEGISQLLIRAEAVDTAGNVATTPVTTLKVIPPPKTTVQGRVFLAEGTTLPAVGAKVLVQRIETLTDANGFFQVSGLSTILGDIRAEAILTFRGVPLRGISRPTRPVADGVTDLGRINLIPAGVFAFPKKLVANGLTTATLLIVLLENGLPVPDGTLVGITAAPLRPLGEFGFSAGGSIENGIESPEGGGIRIFETKGGVVFARYRSPVLEIPAGETRLGLIDVEELDAQGRLFPEGRTLAFGVIELTGPIVATVTPSVLFANGMTTATVVFSNLLFPDGTPFAVTAESVFDLVSAGGTIEGGSPSPTGKGFQIFQTKDHKLTVKYRSPKLEIMPGEAPVGVIQGAFVDFEGFVLTRAFSTEVPLATPSSITAAPPTLLANGETRSLVAVSNLRDGRGQIVPDGTRWALTAEARFFPSAGGTIEEGQPSPESPAIQIFSSRGGAFTAIYRSPNLGLAAGDRPEAVVQLATVDATDRIEQFVTSDRITLVGVNSAQIFVEPEDIHLDFQESALFTATRIRDREGFSVPDGTLIAATAASRFLPSAGGEIEAVPRRVLEADFSFQLFQTRSGSIAGRYLTPQIPLGVGQFVQAEIQVASVTADLRPLSLLGSRPVFVLGAKSAVVTVDPPVLFSRDDQTASVTVTRLFDLNGNPLPDGTTVALTAAPLFLRSIGGAIEGGLPSPLPEVSLFTVQGGRVTAVYRARETGVIPADLFAGAVIQVALVDAAGVPTNLIGQGRVSLVGKSRGTVFAIRNTLVAQSTETTQVRVVSLRDAAGNLIPDGTRCAITAEPFLTDSAGGVIEGGEPGPPGTGLRIFTAFGGAFTALYRAPDLEIAPGQVLTATLQITLAEPLERRPLIATGNVNLVSPKTAIVLGEPGRLLADPRMSSVVTVSNLLHPRTGEILPDGTEVLMTAQTFLFPSFGGTLSGGTPIPFGFGFSKFTVSGGRVQAVYHPPPPPVPPGETRFAKILVMLADAAGIPSVLLARGEIGLVGKTASIVEAIPDELLADGFSKAIVIVSATRDADGNIVPDGTLCAVTAQTFFLPSAGGEILDGMPSPNGGGFKLFKIQNGGFQATYRTPSLPAGAAPAIANVQVASVDPMGRALDLVGSARITLIAPSGHSHHGNSDPQGGAVGQSR